MKVEVRAPLHRAAAEGLLSGVGDIIVTGGLSEDATPTTADGYVELGGACLHSFMHCGTWPGPPPTSPGKIGAP